MNCSSRARGGCNTGNLSLSASDLTGDGCNFKSRPFGFSGCVTTAATENLSSRASDTRLAQDNPAVPMKTILIDDLRFMIDEFTVPQWQGNHKSRIINHKSNSAELRDVFEDVG